MSGVAGSNLPDLRFGPVPLSIIRCPSAAACLLSGIECKSGIYRHVHRCRSEARRHILAAIDSVNNRAHLIALSLSITLHVSANVQWQQDVSSTIHLQRRGKKLLVLDPKISAYLGFLTEIALLREHGVERWCCAQLAASARHG